MKIVLTVLLITVASALDHYDPFYPWKRSDDLKIATRSVAPPINVKETHRLQRSGAQTIQRSRLSNSLKGDVLQSSSRRTPLAEDSSQQHGPWTVRTEEALMRENRAIGSTLTNMISRPSSSNLEQYQYFSNLPYNDDALSKNRDSLKDGEFEEYSKDSQDHFLVHNAEEVEWSGQDVFEKDELDEDINERGKKEIQEFLDEIRRRRLNGEFEESVGAYRQGRRRKLTSQQQSALLVDTLRKKQNYTNDHRGHSSNLQSGIMDMLGRSMFVRQKMERKYCRGGCYQNGDHDRGRCPFI
jgi:hypothetical protein